MADETDAILDNAQGLKKATGDGHSAEQHSLLDQIEADRYLASKAAATGIRIQQNSEQLLISLRRK